MEDLEFTLFIGDFIIRVLLSRLLSQTKTNIVEGKSLGIEQLGKIGIKRTSIE